MTSTLDHVADLMDAFPRQEVRPRTVERYVEELADIPPTTLGAAVKYLVRTEKFFPSIAEIRGAAAEIALTLPSEEDALGQVERKISDRAAPQPHPDVKRALDHVGGFFAFRTTSEPSILRAQFLKMYRDIRAERVRSLQLGFATWMELGTAA